MKDVYTIVEGGRDDNRNDSYWIRVGVAFENKDKSINIKLNALPVNGTLHIRDRKEGSNGTNESKEE